MKKIILPLLLASNLLANSDVTNMIKKSDYKSFKDYLKEDTLTANELEIYYDLAEKKVKNREKNLINDSYEVTKKSKAYQINNYDILTGLLIITYYHLNYEMYKENIDLHYDIDNYSSNEFDRHQNILTCKLLAVNFGSYGLFRFLRKSSNNESKQNFKNKKNNVYEKYVNAMKIKGQIATLRESS